MNIRRNRHFKAEVSTSSLNDIMFFLLLFFLIVSTLANPNVIKIMLPKSEAAHNISRQQVNLTVTEDKRYYVNQKEVQLDNLENELKSRTIGIENPTVVLRFAKTLDVQDLVDVLAIGVRMNLKMVMSTEKNNS
ncbi:MAG TPA: biopolymer transporter ExbD [Bacteroidales bacterium]|nr:biopolymer transporter ExbD [Bacteroidales bacterium]